MKRIPPPYSNDLESLVWPMSAAQFISRSMQAEVRFQQGCAGRLALLRAELGAFDLSFLFDRASGTTVWEQGGRETRRGTDSAKDAEALLPGVTIQAHLTKLPFAKQFIADMARQMGLESGFFSIFASQDARTAVHYDRNYNFTIQLAGSKTWTVHCSEPAVYAPSDCSALEEDRLARMSPSLHGTRIRPPTGHPSTFVLEPGDILYVPPGFWHGTECVGCSVQLNVSLEPRSWAEVVGRLVTKHLESRAHWRAPFGSPAPSDALPYLNELTRIVDSLSAEDLVLSPRIPQATSLHEPLRRTLGSLMMWETEGAGVFFEPDELRYLARGTAGREIETLKIDLEPVVAELAQLDHDTTIATLSEKHSIRCQRVGDLIDRLLQIGYLTRSQSTNASSNR